MKSSRQINTFFFSLSILILFSLMLQLMQAQDKKKPQAFRTAATATAPFVLPSTLDLQLLEAFMLMQKANAGESPAQHELGLRYLLGRGFPADTPKAVIWIQKAAEQHLPLAEYNYGILLMNGMGAEWDPFKAFNYFRSAAEKENPEALYVTGLLYTEDLIVPRRWPAAYKYIRRASELGSEAAKISKKEIERRGFDTTEISKNGESKIGQVKNNTQKTISGNSEFNLLFIDFKKDTVSAIEDTTLIREARQGIPAYSASSDNSHETKIDSGAHSMFLLSANMGNPEALCLLGRCHERGLNVQKDLILAGVYYLRALRWDSYRAPALLWKLMVTEEFSRELEAKSSINDPNALFVWSGLFSAGFNKILNEKQAFDLLQRAASAGHLPAMVELGLCCLTGKWTQKNSNKAVEWWNRASASGSVEADIRLAAANVLGQIHTQEFAKALSILQKTSKQGSLYSDLTLAYCYEKGIGLPMDKGEAYRIFHKALFRGSETAFHALRSMHDAIRPPDKEYRMQE